MGTYAVRALLGMKACDEIIVADLDEKRAASFAEKAGEGVSPLALDVSDQEALDRAVSEADLVMNTVGPFFKFGKIVLSSCIRIKRHYVDICDDWQPTLELLELNDQAREAGITAIIGMGASPGVSNVLGKKAIAELDSAESIFTGWSIDAAKPERVGDKASAATVHGIYQLSGTIRVFDGGKYIDALPIKPVDLDYPGIGVRRTYTIGHPESVTFPRYFPELQKSQNVFLSSLFNVVGLNVISWLVNRKLLTIDNAAHLAEMIEGAARPEETPAKMLADLANKKKAPLPPMFGLALGTKDGAPASAACAILSAPAGGMGGITGVPLAVSAAMVLGGKVKERGVFAPEGALDPDQFLDTLAPLCSPRKNDAADLVLTTRSWDTEDLDFSKHL